MWRTRRCARQCVSSHPCSSRLTISSKTWEDRLAIMLFMIEIVVMIMIHQRQEAFDGDFHWLWWLWLIKRTFVCQMSNIHDILMVTSIDNDGSDEKHFPSRLRISRAGQGKCKGGWSICRRGFRSTIPRRRPYVSLFSSNKLADKWRSMYIQCSHSCIVRT